MEVYVSYNDCLCSVVIPAYKCASYIAQTIESVRSQTYTNLEIIIVNDCSPDNTEEIILTYVQLDSRIIYLKHHINKGVSETRNTGIRAAKGDWIALIDSDDCWLPDKLEKQMYLARAKSAVLCYTGCEFIANDGRALKRCFNVPDKVGYKKLLYQNVIVCSSVLIKKELLLENPMHGDYMHEDYATWLTILKTHAFAYGINEPLVRYRIADNSKSRNKLKSLKMTYEVYKYMNLGFFRLHFYIIANAINGLKKYGRIAF